MCNANRSGLATCGEDLARTGNWECSSIDGVVGCEPGEGTGGGGRTVDDVLHCNRSEVSKEDTHDGVDVLESVATTHELSAWV
jgi:hypothetical protein